MDLRSKSSEIRKELQKIIESQVEETKLSSEILLSKDQSIIFNLIKVFVKSLDDSLTDNDIVNMIFRKGLVYELNRIKNGKEYIYNMGNLETLAIENNVDLSEEELKIASTDSPKTIDEYWKLGYVTIKCPNCQNKAVWDKGTKHYICLDGCKKTGLWEDKTD